MHALIALNKKLRGNYAFHCKDTRTTLTIQAPTKRITVLSSSIIRGLEAGTLLDLEGRVDLAKRCFKAEIVEDVEPVKVEEITEEVVEAPVTEEVKEIKEVEKPVTRSSKAKKKGAE